MTADELLLMRRAKRIKQADLAKALGCSRQTVINWESGKFAISPAQARKIMEICADAVLPPDPKKVVRDRETLEAYSELRAQGRSHGYIVAYWSEKSFQPSLEAQAAIAAAYPDILQNN